jgi:hypothetical protein
MNVVRILYCIKRHYAFDNLMTQNPFKNELLNSETKEIS